VFDEYIRKHFFKQCRIFVLLKLVLPDIASYLFDLCFSILYFCLWWPWTWSQVAASLSTRIDVKVYTFFLSPGFLPEMHDTRSFFFMACMTPLLCRTKNHYSDKFTWCWPLLTQFIFSFPPSTKSMSLFPTAHANVSKLRDVWLSKLCW